MYYHVQDLIFAEDTHGIHERGRKFPLWF